MDAPKKIWCSIDSVSPNSQFLGTCWIKGDDQDTEYIRADVAQAMVAELQDEIERLREALKAIYRSQDHLERFDGEINRICETALKGGE